MSQKSRAGGRFVGSIVIVSAFVILTLVTAVLLLRQDFHTTRGMLVHAQSQLFQMDAELGAVRSDLAVAQRELAEARHSMGEMLAVLDTANTQIDTLDATLANLQVNYDRMTSGYGYVLRDPTYAEMVEFLTDDATSSQTYHIEEYNCTDFSADVKANAARLGLRCAYVNVYFPDGIGHAIVAFETTDKGAIFIEPQTDEEVDLRIGRSYNASIVPRPGYYYAEPDYDDTVLRFTVIW